MSVAPWINEASATQPTIRARTAKTKGAVAVTPRRGALRIACTHLAGFTALSFACYGFTSLMGHSLYSAAFKARGHSDFRAETARRDVLELSGQVSSLVSTESLERWARVHGFVRTGSLMAMNNGSSITSREQ